MDMSQYLEIFIEESKEHLQNLNQSLLALENNPEDTSVINEIFRVAHTLKGMSGTMGFNRMSKLTHNMENVLDSLRSKKIKITTILIDVLFKCLDALENYIENISESGQEGESEYPDIIKLLNDANENKLSEEKPAAEEAKPEIKPEAALTLTDFEQNAINKAVSINMKSFSILFKLNKGCLLKSARAFIIFQTLEKNCEIIKAEPSVQDIEDEKFDYEFAVVVLTNKSKDDLLNELNTISEIDDIILNEVEATEDYKKEVAATAKEVNVKTSEIAAVNNDSEHNQKPQAAKSSKMGKTVRVDIDRLDVLMNLVGELIITKTRLEGLTQSNLENNQVYNETVEYLERITTSLNDAVMKVRMVPVETVFNRFPRMMRDISRDLGKEFSLIMSGEETELDRTVIDEIGDPLIHLLRNSADHGIESLEERRKAGKPDAGTINLKAYQDGNNVIIEVSDDGAGINTEKVKQKAIEKGLISADIADTIPEKQIIELLFKPSFSTADKVTGLSGRGVGMDVVKTKIESLGGNVEIESVRGRGTRTIIRLPLTLAIYQALLVYIGGEKYAVPISSVQEIVNIKPEDLKLVQKQEVILLRNVVIPIIRLDKLLEVQSKPSNNKIITVVIVKKGDKLSGFIVDALIGQQEIVIKTLGKLLSSTKSIGGATILGDGDVALILDVNSIA